MDTVFWDNIIQLIYTTAYLNNNTWSQCEPYFVGILDSSYFEKEGIANKDEKLGLIGKMIHDNMKMNE